MMNFRQFIEENDSLSVVDAYKKLGIHPEDWAKMPRTAGLWGVGDVLKNIGNYQVVGFEYKDGKPFIAKVRKMNSNRLDSRTGVENFKKTDNGYHTINAVPDDKIYRIKVGDLTDLEMQPYGANANPQPPL